MDCNTFTEKINDIIEKLCNYGQFAVNTQSIGTDSYTISGFSDTMFKPSQGYSEDPYDVWDGVIESDSSFEVTINSCVCSVLFSPYDSIVISVGNQRYSTIYFPIEELYIATQKFSQYDPDSVTITKN